MGYCSYVAAVGDRGRLKIHRLVMATDCGHIVNPPAGDVAGRRLSGLRSWPHALPGNYDQGRLRGAGTCQMMLMEDFSKFETVLVPSGAF